LGVHIFSVALLAATIMSQAGFTEPSEESMREAFASDLSEGVRAVLAYVTETGGPEALARIRRAQTDAFAITSFRKGECRPSEDGYLCEFAVTIDTVAGPIEKSIAGRFYLGACGLTYDHDA
jgi:hypothetical protein